MYKFETAKKDEIKSKANNIQHPALRARTMLEMMKSEQGLASLLSKALLIDAQLTDYGPSSDDAAGDLKENIRRQLDGAVEKSRAINAQQLRDDFYTKLSNTRLETVEDLYNYTVSSFNTIGSMFPVRVVVNARTAGFGNNDQQAHNTFKSITENGGGDFSSVMQKGPFFKVTQNGKGIPDLVKADLANYEKRHLVYSAYGFSGSAKTSTLVYNSHEPDADTVLSIVVNRLRDLCKPESNGLKSNRPKVQLRMVDLYGEVYNDITECAGTYVNEVGATLGIEKGKDYVRAAQYAFKDGTFSISSSGHQLLRDIESLSSTEASWNDVEVDELVGLPKKFNDFMDQKAQHDFGNDEISRYHVRCTPNNKQSSRAHTFLSLRVLDGDDVRTAVTIIDMAGSENVKTIQEDYFLMQPYTEITLGDGKSSANDTIEGIRKALQEVFEKGKGLKMSMFRDQYGPLELKGILQRDVVTPWLEANKIQGTAAAYTLKNWTELRENTESKKDIERVLFIPPYFIPLSHDIISLQVIDAAWEALCSCNSNGDSKSKNVLGKIKGSAEKFKAVMRETLTSAVAERMRAIPVLGGINSQNIKGVVKELLFRLFYKGPALEKLTSGGSVNKDVLITIHEVIEHVINSLMEARSKVLKAIGTIKEIYERSGILNDYNKFWNAVSPGDIREGHVKAINAFLEGAPVEPEAVQAAARFWLLQEEDQTKAIFKVHCPLRYQGNFIVRTLRKDLKQYLENLQYPTQRLPGSSEAEWVSRLLPEVSKRLDVKFTQIVSIRTDYPMGASLTTQQSNFKQGAEESIALGNCLNPISVHGDRTIDCAGWNDRLTGSLGMEEQSDEGYLDYDATGMLSRVIDASPIVKRRVQVSMHAEHSSGDRPGFDGTKEIPKDTLNAAAPVKKRLGNLSVEGQDQHMGFPQSQQTARHESAFNGSLQREYSSDPKPQHKSAFNGSMQLGRSSPRKSAFFGSMQRRDSDSDSDTPDVLNQPDSTAASHAVPAYDTTLLVERQHGFSARKGQSATIGPRAIRTPAAIQPNPQRQRTRFPGTLEPYEPGHTMRLTGTEGRVQDRNAKSQFKRIPAVSYTLRRQGSESAPTSKPATWR